MKLECSGCKKLVSESDFDSCYSVYQCRKDHIFINCSFDCHRTFEKRCGKVLCCAVKQQHKLNKDGQTSALRKLAPCERDKLKQLSEAQQAGLMICPEDARASERSVPHCAHVLSRRGGTGRPDGAAEQDAPAAPPPARRAAPQPTGSEELLGDDMLVALQKDDEESDEHVLGRKKKKAQKAKRDKKTMAISLDYGFGTRPGEEEWAWLASERPLAFQAAHPASPSSDKAAGEPPRPSRWGAPQAAAVERLQRITTPARSSAEQLSTSASGEDEGPPAQAALAAAPEARGPKAAAGGAGAAEAAQAEHGARVRSGEAEPEAGPAAPPSLPEGWRAVWCEEQGAFYFWHTPSDQTSWDPPEPPRLVDTSGAARAAEQVCRRPERAAADKAEREAAERGAERAAAAGVAASRVGDRYAPAPRADVGEQPERREGAAGQSFVCSRHWRPKAEFTKCVRLLHGECVHVTWADGREDGWAYGRSLDDRSKEGYFPRAVLRELKRELRPRALGERLSVRERFDTPDSVGGYVFVQPGDTLRVLHPMEEPYVWAYVEREGARGAAERGWVPGVVLGEPRANDLDIIMQA